MTEDKQDRNKEPVSYALERSSTVVIRPHPRVMIAQDPQMTARYAPNRVTMMPDKIAVTEAPREYGIILQNTLSCMQRHRVTILT